MSRFLLLFLFLSEAALAHWVEISELRPTQFAVGMKAVLKKAKKNLERMSENQYYQENPVPVVKGPGGTFYMVDGHHFTRAVYEMDYSYVFVKVKHDWSQLSPQAFWKRMKEEKLVYLKDEKGVERQVKDLPRSIQQLKDDPYRSLAWYARKRGAFNKTTHFFVEFAWAEFFRNKISLSTLKNDFDQAIEKAIKVSHSSFAMHLPGYIGSGGKAKCQFAVVE